MTHDLSSPLIHMFVANSDIITMYGYLRMPV